MENVRVKPHEIWAFFKSHREELESKLILIANNEEYGVVIYLSETSGLPQIVVYMDDSQVYEESCVNEKDCEKTVAEIYEDYLTSRVLDTVLDEPTGKNEDRALMEQDMRVSEREDELSDAVTEMLFTVLGDDYYPLSDDVEEITEDLKDHLCEYLFRKYGINIYRPMYLEDENGDEFFEEYPYDCMEFNDPDNPVYK